MASDDELKAEHSPVNETAKVNFVYMGKAVQGGKVAHEFHRLDDAGAALNRVLRMPKLPINATWAREGQVFELTGDGTSFSVTEVRYVGLWVDIAESGAPHADAVRAMNLLYAKNMIANTKAKADEEYLSNDVIKAVQTLKSAASNMSQEERNRLLIYIGRRLG